MQNFTLRRGLTIPIMGAPRQSIDPSPQVREFAVLGDDYLDLKPSVLVQEGDTVGAGAPLIVHKNLPTVNITAPVSGRIKAINRGARRKLISVEIEADPSAADAVDFSKVGDVGTADGVVERLCASGLWTSFRTRPYSKLPDPATRPAAIYVTAMDTEPLAPDAGLVIGQEPEAFIRGLEAVAALSDGKTYLCCDADGDIPGGDVRDVEVATFRGPHPAGLAGTHMHFLQPPTVAKVVWTIGYPDVIAIGRLMMTGAYDPSRVIALCGPVCRDPRLVQTIDGASMAELTQSDCPDDLPIRVISGSVLSGRAGDGQSGYLGRYARQITLIEEDKKQIPMGWIRPMPSKYAVQPVLGSAFAHREFPLTSNLNGGRRAMVPLGTFEALMPQDFLPTQLLRALLVMDTDQAQALGALELDEEDLGLVGFACPAKYEYGLALRDCLTKIEKEG
ncbi:MAG: Na(+)-translocating NADH-quinone reductase subunit A [Pseudomonadota bacterium]